MTQTTHTPGPWKVSGHMVRTDCANSWFVANCCYGTTDAIEANARLIAAAPDLLAALKSVAEFIADEVEQRGLAGSNMSDYEDEAVQALYRVEAAITKATGAN